MPKPKPDSKPPDLYTDEAVVGYLNNAVVAVCGWQAVDRSYRRLLKMRGLAEALVAMLRDTQRPDPEVLESFSDAEVVLVLQTASLLFLTSYLGDENPLRNRAAAGLVALPKPTATSGDLLPTPVPPEKEA